MCCFYSNTFHTQQLTILEIMVLRTFRRHSNQTLHSNYLIFLVCCFYSNTFHTQQVTKLEILVLRAFRRHSNQTLHSRLLMWQVCCFYSNTFSHTTVNRIGYSGAESVSRALQSNTSLTSLNIGVLFLFKHLSHTTVNRIGYCEYHTEKRKQSFQQPDVTESHATVTAPQS